MAQIESNDGGGKKKKGGSKQKKFSVHVDFTPMVDMNMLLITFFMLCTSLSKPQTMEISMPSNDPNIKEEQQAKVKASQAITVLLSGKDKIYYFTGQPQYNNPQSLTPTSYTAEGLRKFLLTRNLEAAKAVAKLKEEKKDKKISEDTFKKKVAEINHIGLSLCPSYIPDLVHDPASLDCEDSRGERKPTMENCSKCRVPQ